MATDMKDIINKMKCVNEPGLISEEDAKNYKKAALSNESNSMTNAIMAYSKMTINEQQVPIPVVEKKEITEKDHIRAAGAAQVIKELVTEEKINKKTAYDIIQKVKTILSSFE